MESFSEEEDQFFEAREDIRSVSDSSSDCPENLDSDCGVVDSLPISTNYEVWIKSLGSIHERRNKFLRWMGLNFDETTRDDPGNPSSQETEVQTDRMTEHGGAVLRSSNFDDRFSSSHSSMSCCSSDTLDLLDGVLEENFMYRIRNLDDGTEFIVDEDGLSGRIRQVGSNRFLTVAEFERSLGLSPLVQTVMRREAEALSKFRAARKRVKRGWLRRLGVVACVVDRQVETGGMGEDEPYSVASARAQIVRVRSYKKRVKEFSALYMRQDFPAHEGSILTMKFSPDGQYLASAGEDGIVRVWQVMELERSNEFGTLDIDPSHVYFEINNLSELVPLRADKEKKGKLKNLLTSDLACVIFPQKVFQISEKPIHEFYGHCGEILDLSWSKNKHLLSSSTDKTVRLWKLGCNQCVEVFSHNNYDNRLQLCTKVCLQGKKKSPFKRITGFQFSPSDPTRLMVTSADSKVRILSGVDVICKYRGIHNAGSQISASFTPDGTHIISASEDSNVYVWNYSSQDLPVPHSKNNWACERFFSNNASVAIPWSGITCGNSFSSNIFGTMLSFMNLGQCNDERILVHSELGESSELSLPFSSPDHFSRSQGFFSESLSKGSATWPEEKLPLSSPRISSKLCKSHYKFLKTSFQTMYGSHAWGSVIVTAGWDGRIRWFQNYGLPICI
ncbi:WD repeat-containing protein 44 isoform X4 [Manihot esculenta]|uniref:WD repeat-containing protein 44 isoform X4 n=1 Tax=Manihot esculenta TaxID=3983 RepID=UPI001CC61E61|nr:WD repeat-containing protein 44 isoform X4 [Manihot esculenta]